MIIFFPSLSTVWGAATMAVAVAAATALGQIGESPSAFIARYGTPLLQTNDEAGVERFAFKSGKMEIAAWSRMAVVQRVVYLTKDLDEGVTRHLLLVNKGSSEWASWDPPGQSGTNLATRAWLRADDGAMASLKPGSLIVTAADWNRSPPPVTESPPIPSTNASPQTVTTNAGATPPPPALPAAPIRIKPRPPARLPRVGDSREEAIRLLGREKGAVRSGSLEIIRYEWGLVHIENGKVIRIE